MNINHKDHWIVQMDIPHQRSPLHIQWPFRIIISIISGYELISMVPVKDNLQTQIRFLTSSSPITITEELRSVGSNFLWNHRSNCRIHCNRYPNELYIIIIRHLICTQLTLISTNPIPFIYFQPNMTLGFFSWTRRRRRAWVPPQRAQGVRHDIRAAQRAIHIRFQPSIDAGKVKPMDTIGKKPEILILLKLVQTDGTLGPFKKTSTSLVFAHSDRVYHRFIKTHTSIITACLILVGAANCWGWRPPGGVSIAAVLCNDRKENCKENGACKEG